MNCRTHEHRHFERTLRVSDFIRYPHLAEGRITMTSYGRLPPDAVAESVPLDRMKFFTDSRRVDASKARSGVRAYVSLGVFLAGRRAAACRTSCLCESPQVLKEIRLASCFFRNACLPSFSHPVVLFFHVLSVVVQRKRHGDWTSPPTGIVPLC